MTKPTPPRQDPDSFVLPLVGPDGHVRPLDQVVGEAIDVALQIYKNRTEAARRLGMGRATLYRFLDANTAPKP